MSVGNKRKGSDLRANLKVGTPQVRYVAWVIEQLRVLENAVYYTIISNFVDIWNLFVCLFLAFQRFLNTTEFKLGLYNCILHLMTFCF